jgi:uncharacterized membrane protein
MEGTHMSQIIETIDVDVPIRTAYDQWTQFEEFPLFMDSVKTVEQLDDSHIRWTANIGGVEKQWVAEITEQTPDERIAWRSVEGAKNAGVVTFHHLADDKTRVTLQLDVEPDGPVESIGDALGLVARQAKGDMERFKAFIESRGAETGAWRGKVAQGSSR